MPFFATALAACLKFLSRWFWLIITVSVVICAGSLMRACSVAQQANRIFQGQPPLPAKEAKKIIAAGRRDSVKAVVYLRIAKVAVQQADSLKTVRRRAVGNADSFHTIYEKVPAATGGPLPAIRRRLATYHKPDTAGL